MLALLSEVQLREGHTATLLEMPIIVCIYIIVLYVCIICIVIGTVHYWCWSQRSAMPARQNNRATAVRTAYTLEEVFSSLSFAFSS